MMNIAFTGHRNRLASITNLEWVAEKFPNATWIHGGAIGFDTQVRSFALQHGIPLREILPDYNTHRGGRQVVLRIEWDHRYPFAYSQDNREFNFVASCQVCNKIKSDKIFQSLEESQIYIGQQRRNKGYNFSYLDPCFGSM